VSSIAIANSQIEIPSYRVLNVRVDAVQIPDAVRILETWIAERGPARYVAVAEFRPANGRRAFAQLTVAAPSGRTGAEGRGPGNLQLRRLGSKPQSRLPAFPARSALPA